MKLEAKQIETFREQGYLVLRGFADASLCDDILAKAKKHLKDKVEPIETELGYASQSKNHRTEVKDYSSKQDEEVVIVRRLRQVYEREAVFIRWMEDEDLRPVLQQILEDQVVITTAHHNSIMTKMPQSSTATSWHQDRRYWRYSDDNLVSVWLALDDENDDNGVLEFIPASHKVHFSASQFDEKEYFSQTFELNKPYIAKKVSTSLKKGDVVLFHSLLLHRANKNTTKQVKISFVYTVKGSKTKAIEGTRSAEFPEIVLPRL